MKAPPCESVSPNVRNDSPESDSDVAATGKAAEIELDRLTVLLEWLRRLHAAADDPRIVKPVLARVLGTLVRADDAMLVVSRIDPASGAHEVLDVTLWTADRCSVCQSSHEVRRSVLPVSEANGSEPIASASIGSEAPGPAPGPVMDSFLWLDGIGLCAGVTVSRRPESPKFSMLDRAWMERVHQHAAFAYAFDLWLARHVELNLGTATGKWVRDWVAGRTARQIAIRRAEPVRKVQAGLRAVREKLGVRTAADLLSTWRMEIGSTRSQLLESLGPATRTPCGCKGSSGRDNRSSAPKPFRKRRGSASAAEVL